MNANIFFTLVLGALIVLFLIYKQHKDAKLIKHANYKFNEAALIAETFLIKSNYKWSVIAKAKDNLSFIAHENDDLGNIGYYIYSSYQMQLLQSEISVYVKDNIHNKCLKIIIDGSSESMMGVDHPHHGHIGYLSFEELGMLIDKVDIR